MTDTRQSLVTLSVSRGEVKQEGGICEARRLISQGHSGSTVTMNPLLHKGLPLYLPGLEDTGV